MTADREAHDNGDQFDALIERSSLGAPGARRLRQRISHAEAESILQHADLIETSSLESQTVRQIHSSSNADVVKDAFHGSLALDIEGASRISGQVCAMLAVDLVEFTRPARDEEVQLHLRMTLYGIVREALGGSGMPWELCQYEDRGDGVMVVFPPDLAAQPIVDVLPERLRGLIRRHNRVSREAARMQLRVAANVGPVYRDEHGFSGDDVMLLCRMLDAQPLRRALSESGSEFAFIISDYVYEKLVLHRQSLADPRSFRRVKTRVKRTPVNAWMALPDVLPL